MNITPETIQQLYQHYDELDALREAASDAIKAAKEQQDKRVTITRRDGTKQEVTEKMLWEEVWNLSADSEAGAHLRQAYPDAFEKSEAAERKVAELRAFTLAELGIDAQQLKLSDIVRIVDALVDYKLNERQDRQKEGEKGSAETAA